MSIYRTIAKHTATYSAALIIGKMASFVLMPIYTRHLTPADYGVMELLDLAIFILTALFGTRLADSLFYFHSQAATEERRAQVVGTAFLSSIVLGFLGAAAGWLAVEPLSMLVFGNAAYAHYFRIVFLGFGFIFVEEMGFGYLRVVNRSGAYVAGKMAHLALMVALSLILLIRYDMGVGAMLWSSAAAAAAVSLGLAALVLSNNGAHFDFRLAAKMVRYAIPLGLSAIGMTVMHSGDRFFLQRSVPLADVGVYALGYKFGMLVAFIQLAFITYWNAQVFQVVRLPDGDRTYVRVCTYFVLCLASLAVVLSTFSVPIIRVMTTPAFQGAAALVPAIAAIYVMRGLGDYFRGVFAIHNRPDLNAKVTGYAVVITLAAYATLIPRFHLWGAAAATAIAFLAMDLVAFYEAQKVRAYSFEWRRLAQIALAGAAAVAPPLLLRPDSVVLQCVLAAACTLVFPALLATIGFFEPEEKEWAVSMLRQLRGRIRGAAVGGVAGRA